MSAEGDQDPWLSDFGAHAERHRRQRAWTRQRLRLLLEPDSPVAAWQRIRATELKLHGNTSGVLFGVRVTVWRELAESHRYTMRGQLAIEGGYVKERGGIDGNAVEALRRREVDIYRSLMACVVCRQEKALRNLWICEACYRAWRRAGRPRDHEYMSFRRGRLRDAENASKSDKPLSQLDFGISPSQRTFDSSGHYNRDIDICSDEDSMSVPIEVLPRPLVEVVIRGEPDQVAAMIRKMGGVDSEEAIIKRANADIVRLLPKHNSA